MLIVIALSIHFSVAFFKFKKQFSSSGELPILNLSYNVTTSNEYYATNKKLMYSPGNIDFKVDLSTQNNNINGYIRFSIWLSWQNGLPNEVLNEDGNLITVCIFEIDNTVWERRNGYYYLKNDAPVEPNQTITLFTTISFAGEVSEIYQFQTVDFKIIPEIVQATNRPENW